MKLRIKGNSLRLRLTQQEVLKLSQGQGVEEITMFTPIQSFTYSLQPWELQVANASMENYVLSVKCPEAHIKGWAKSDDVSLQYTQDNGSNGGLLILIEKDFACLNQRKDEDESDMFPNPSKGIC